MGYEKRRELRLIYVTSASTTVLGSSTFEAQFRLPTLP